MTHPTIEQALAALKAIQAYEQGPYTASDVFMECHLETIKGTLATYIEGEKDSLGADEARKWVKCPICKETDMPFIKECDEGGYIRCNNLGCYSNQLSAPASAHVPGIEKVREKIRYIAEDGFDIQSMRSAAEEALAILDQLGAPAKETTCRFCGEGAAVRIYDQEDNMIHIACTTCGSKSDKHGTSELAWLEWDNAPLEKPSLDDMYAAEFSLCEPLDGKKEMVSSMAAAYEEERAKYVGGIVYYPNNGAAHMGAMMKALAVTGHQPADRIQDLLEANNRYLQRARDTEQKLADLRAKVEGMRNDNTHDLSYYHGHNAALDAVIKMIDGLSND